MSDESMFYLVAVEVAGIQSYIFNSNRLRENVGASELVALATERWALSSLYEATGGSCNVTQDAKLIAEEHVDYQIDKNTNLKAEVLYSGGGNFVAIFRHEPIAKTFARELSQKVICEAPGLHLNLHSAPYKWQEIEEKECKDQTDKKSLRCAVADLLRDMKQQRSQHLPNTALGGLGVTAVGGSTSLPAVWVDVDQDDNAQLYAAETMAKRKAGFDQANERLRRLVELDHYQYPLDFDDLGRSKGEKSFVGVVHADGNNMGLIFQGLGEGKSNREYIADVRYFSERTKTVAQATLEETIQFLLSCIDTRGDAPTIHGVNNQASLTLSKHKKTGNYILPFRPLVFGGDDITFVCDGRIAIDLAVKFTEAFERHSAENLPIKLTAGVGIAIVNTHYPFARAYELAEDLISNAKKLLHDIGLDRDNSAIDWHFTTGGLYGESAEIRKREYTVPYGNLTLRPLLLGTTDDESKLHAWNTVKEITSVFQGESSLDETAGAQSRISRNKAKRLMDALRDGKVNTRHFIKQYLADVELPVFDSSKSVETQAGWHKHDGVNYCFYFDALELMDVYVPLIPIMEETHG